MPMGPRRWKRKSAPKRKPAARRAAGARRRPVAPARYVSRAGDLTNSLCRYGRRPTAQVRSLRTVGAPDAIVFNGGFNVYPTQGKQVYKWFGSLTQGQLEDIASTAGNQSSPNRVLIQSAHTNISFTNITNTSAEMEIYDIVFKRDVPAEFAYNYGSPPINYSIDGYDVASLIEQGVAAATSAPSGSSNYLSLGTSPFDSQPFKVYCKVLRRTHVMLQSGASHRHDQYMLTNRVLDQSVIPAELASIKGFSYGCLVKVNGAPAYVPSGEQAELGTTADITIQATYSVRIKYTFVQDVNSSLVINDVMATSPAATTRNPGSGALEPISP